VSSRLLTHAAIVKLIANTRTSTGLKVRRVLDTRAYPPKIAITDKQMEQINLSRMDFHGEWSYTVVPIDITGLMLSRQ
jgi:hypothetical protein